ncbi:hypothetical protein OHA10_04945 [Kribbella sp. NBC_00662]|uniref:hypothetical protein n=1 Tax=Kribbella sp. NBC_00662 TaxID=2975969 RepID=UPI0032550630
MKALTVLRMTAALHAVAICLQPVFAGIYLDGSPGGMRMHEPTGLAIVFLGLAQLLIATIWWRAGGRWQAAAVSLLILVVEVVQVSMGYSRQLAIHIPLGIALVGGTVAVAFWINRQRVSDRQPDREQVAA